MKINWTEPAVKDLEKIQEYIAQDSEYYAVNFIEKIIDAVDSLDTHPQRGRIVPEADKPNIRELIYHNYRLMYRIEENSLTVLAIIHASRDIKDKDSQPWEIS